MRKAAVLSGIVIFILFVLLIFSTTIVPPRNVGVEVYFGRTSRVLSPGLHLTKPFASVVDMDGTIQNDSYVGDRAVEVRLGNNSKAKADASVRWQIKLDSAEQLFLDYKDFDGIRQNLVDREFRSAINEVMAGYNPLSPDSVNREGNDLGELAHKTLELMRQRVGDKVEIHSVVIPIVDFDDATQNKLDELQAEIARTRTAEQRQKTAAAESEANRKLSEGITTEVLVSKCLDIADRNNQSPLGCFPGTSALPTVQR